MTHTMGTKGQVVIPKAIRDEIGISPGDEVDFAADGREVRIRRADDRAAKRERIESLRGVFADTPGMSAAALEADRREEREREDRREAERRDRRTG
jgi:antitoxin PrlF